MTLVRNISQYTSARTVVPRGMAQVPFQLVMMNGSGSRGYASDSGAPMVPPQNAVTPQISDDGIMVRKGTGMRSSVSGLTVTVFGANGFLGRYICSKLGKVGSQIVVPRRSAPDEYRRLRVMGDLGQVHFKDYHLRDADSIDKVIQHSNVVINCIGRDFDTRNFSIYQANAGSAEAIAEACARAPNVQRLIHVSCLGASAKSPSALFRAKFDGEEAVKSIYPSATIIRPSAMFGYEDKYLNSLAEWFLRPGGVPLVRGGMVKRAPVHVLDVALGVVNAITDPDAPGKTYQLVGPKTYTMEEIVDYLARTTVRKKACYYVPEFAVQTMGSIMGSIPLYTPMYSGDQGVRYGLDEEVDPTLPGFADLGITPNTMEATALKFLRMYRKHVYYGDAISNEDRKGAHVQFPDIRS
eukprot:Clim_evm12s230 gene=Clim_evmTU12s230